MLNDPVDDLLTEILTPGPDREPYDAYRRLREDAPAHRAEATGMWSLTRYDDVKAILHDRRFGRGANLRSPGLAGLVGGLDTGRDRLRALGDTMLFADPPEHGRLRGLVSRAFTPRRIEALRPAIERLVEPLLDDLASAGSGDVLDLFAFPFPVAVIGELLGVPAPDQAAFRSLVRDSTAFIEAAPSEADLDRAEAALSKMTAYFDDLVDQRSKRPADDLLSAMLAVDAGGDRLTREEIVSTAILLFGAGFETTTNLIGNGLLTLLRHPDELARLRTDPTLVPGAVEEILRYESPVQINARTALHEADLLGEPIETGTLVVTFLGAANRDPLRYEEPETFDVGRTDVQPLSFGWGIHHCLGAELARVEGQIAFERLLARFPRMDLVHDRASWRPSLTLRGLAELQVQVTPA
jgi:cytochrome P450